MNMSYCRFQNTLSDLQDCFYNKPCNNLSNDEAEAFASLILLCNQFAAEYDKADYHELIDLSKDEDEEN